MAELREHPDEHDLSEDIRNLQSTVIQLQTTVIELLRQSNGGGSQQTSQANHETESAQKTERENGVPQPDWDGDEDFIVTENLSSPNLASSKARQQRLIDYHVSLDMAKELAMVENNPQGRRVRRYFIACERQLIGNQRSMPVEPTPPPNATPTRTPFQECGVHDAEFLAFLAVTRGRMGGRKALAAGDDQVWH